MTTLTIPTPFRPFTDGESAIEIEANDVGGAIQELVTKYPTLEQHLYTDDGELRSFVNLFLNGEDIRYLNGRDTELSRGDKLRIIPSIAGGNAVRKVDQTALKTNQAAIVLLTILAYLLNLPTIVALVTIIMLVGTIIGKPGFGFIYSRVLRPLNILKPEIIPDDPASHRFAQGVGVLFLAAALISFTSQLLTLGWVLSWVVIALAFINLVSGFCLGCTVYYWVQKIKRKSQPSPEGTN